MQVSRCLMSCSTEISSLETENLSLIFKVMHLLVTLLVTFRCYLALALPSELPQIFWPMLTWFHRTAAVMHQCVAHSWCNSLILQHPKAPLLDGDLVTVTLFMTGWCDSCINMSLSMCQYFYIYKDVKYVQIYLWSAVVVRFSRNYIT